MEQDKYIGQILRLTRLVNPEMANVEALASYSVTPITHRRSAFATKLEKAVQTMRHAGGNAGASNPSVSSSSSSGASQPAPSSNLLNAFTNNPHQFGISKHICLGHFVIIRLTYIIY